ncbi:NACHT domain-containing protein [Flavobacterium yafengii]|uniref:NACHT domain-containing protein n=1 Tax=Flavobacterium yafengii TaxID=3041253 RepID=UPI0024A8149B|nr:ATP-binding protein [Flavobacterium yafengii]MDI5888416.1 ATP-binding protein [Flavobacterium yafengii]
MGIRGFFINIFNPKKYSFGDVTESEINIFENCEINERPLFEVNEHWFETLFVKHYTKDIQSKYDSSLFVDQDKGKASNLLNEIKFNTDHYSLYKNELRILIEWLDKFPIEYQELKDFLAGESIKINIESKQYIQLEILLHKIESIKGSANEQKAILESGINSINTSLPLIVFDDYEHSHGFNSKKIGEYEDDLKFINQKTSEEYPIEIVFRRQSQILQQIRSLNLMEVDFFNRIKLIHGKAGMGKSNISAFLVNSLKDDNHPVILIKAKDFRGNPDEFNRILIEQLLVPINYSIEEVLDNLNTYGKTLAKRVVLIFDGLNETTFANEGFSKIWEKNFDTFIQLLSNYKFIYLVTTLRTSYISRIWSNNQIPYSNFELSGFNNSNIELVVSKYFEHYKITFNQLNIDDIFYFKTPLLIDLYCQMLNPSKLVEVKAIFGLHGFKDVFEKYILNLSQKVKQKLGLGTIDQVNDGIDRCSDAMINNLEANIPIMNFHSLMQNQNVINVHDTIGNEILSEYLIYLDENHNGRDVVIHTQQEVGGYLLAKKLIQKHGSIDEIVNTEFFINKIIGTIEPTHQLKDDILKFLVLESDVDSLLFKRYISNPIIKKFTLITLKTEKSNLKTTALQVIINGTLTNKEYINEILDGFRTTFFDIESPLNFNFIKSQLTFLNNNDFEYTWTKLIYDNYYEIDRLVSQILKDEIVLDKIENEKLIIDFLIWVLETTIRKLRDQVTIILFEYFNKYPHLIFHKVFEYANIDKPYIYERLVSICYGICLQRQNDDGFINSLLKVNIDRIYNLQFGQNPTNPKYNYIVVDSIKHLVDLAMYKEIFTVSEAEIDNFNNYKFTIDSWFEIKEYDIEKVKEIYLHWTLSDNPEPLRGDFVHYTIPRLEKRGNENRLTNTANIYRQILNLGYIPNQTELSKTELKFKNGESLYGVEDKIDRLGKKYSWMSFFDYAGHLLNEGKLDVWQEEDSEYKNSYSRLGDIEIEITNPKPITFNEKLYLHDLFSHIDESQNWVYEPMYDTLLNLFENKEFTMLSGFINQRQSESYDNRSFLLIDSFFIKKESISGNIDDILGREFDWKDDATTSRNSLSKVYFGELYWADNIPIAVLNQKDLPLEIVEEIERMITPHDIINYPEKYKKEDLNKFVKIIKKKRISFEFEQSLIDYLWESNSKVIPSISSTIPNTNIGKQMGLKADTKNLQILDKNNILAHKSFDFEEDYYSQNFEYFRTELLLEYMKINNYLLVYQVKQHSYDRNSGDGTGDFRGMRFFLSSLNK